MSRRQNRKEIDVVALQKTLSLLLQNRMDWGQKLLMPSTYRQDAKKPACHLF